TPPASTRIAAIAATLVITAAAVRDALGVARMEGDAYFPIRFFYALAILVFAGVVAAPLAMSLLHPHIQRSFVADWTYIQEPRYFNFCYPVILLFVVHYLLSPRSGGLDVLLRSSLAAFIGISFCLRPMAAPRPFMISGSEKIGLLDMPHGFFSRFSWIAGRRLYVDDGVDLGLSEALEQMPANFAYVEFGPDSIDFYQRNLEVNMAGAISAAYAGTGAMSTSRPIHILAGLQPGAGPEAVQAFSRFCEKQSAQLLGGANQLSLHQCDFSPSSPFQ
ncbi:MAG: hypothetical protein JO102_02535, partial [Elusimicrobia bacterium]|nr:hypothetical protein [Elusimicrobiota bacterium]